MYIRSGLTHKDLYDVITDPVHVATIKQTADPTTQTMSPINHKTSQRGNSRAGQKQTVLSCVWYTVCDLFSVK